MSLIDIFVVRRDGGSRGFYPWELINETGHKLRNQIA